MNMNDKKRFEVKRAHLKLMKNLQFGYNDLQEFGAPEVDPKRPYGNSDVYEDIAEILEIEPTNMNNWGDKEYSDEQRKAMIRIHKDMTTILQILVVNNGIQAGIYEASRYGNNWKLVKYTK